MFNIRHMHWDIYTALPVDTCNLAVYCQQHVGKGVVHIALFILFIFFKLYIVAVPPLANVTRVQQKWPGSAPVDWLQHQFYGWNVGYVITLAYVITAACYNIALCYNKQRPATPDM
uniref:Uncharacterized protein n=1 Tax=Romanomermis culicivorax TaxID=13658 RepID=A0A915J905_ROMCU